MFSRFQRATSSNIVYTGPNANIGPDAITTSSNFSKYLFNNAGTLQWNTLALPDPAIQTSDKDKFSLVYDFASKSFILRKAVILYDPLFDPYLKYYFTPNSTNTTWTGSTLTSVKNRSMQGTTYDIGTNSNTLITNGGNFTLDNNVGLKISPTIGAGFFQCNNSFTPRTANHAFVFGVKVDFNLPTKPQGPYPFYRTVPAFNGTNNSTLQCLLNYNTTTNLASVSCDATPTQMNTTPESIPSNSYQIYSFINLNGVLYSYRNGVLLQQVTSQQNYTHTNFVTLLQGNIAGANSWNMYGTIYAIALMENITSIKDVQKIEGDIKWSSTSGLGWTLDASHPYAFSTPTL